MIMTGGSLQYNTLNVGFNPNNTGSPNFATAAVGTLTINGGTLMSPPSNDNTYVGWGPGSKGTVNLISGSWGDPNNSDGISYCKIGGFGGTGIVNQSGGSAYFGGNPLMIPFGNNGNAWPVEDGSGTYNISGGTAYVNATLGLCYDNNVTTGWATNGQIDRDDNGTMNVSGSGLVLATGAVERGRHAGHLLGQRGHRHAQHLRRRVPADEFQWNRHRGQS